MKCAFEWREFVFLYLRRYENHLRRYHSRRSQFITRLTYLRNLSSGDNLGRSSVYNGPYPVILIEILATMAKTRISLPYLEPFRSKVRARDRDSLAALLRRQSARVSCPCLLSALRQVIAAHSRSTYLDWVYKKLRHAHLSSRR